MKDEEKDGEIRRILRKEGCHPLPHSFQSPTPPRKADKSLWRPCEECGRDIPVCRDFTAGPQGSLRDAGTVTYACPFCRHVHIGMREGTEGSRKQTHCHDCRASLGDTWQCPSCSLPRGWMTVPCPYCRHPQPVAAPHMTDGCDMFRLECVFCESVFDSYCIC